MVLEQSVMANSRAGCVLCGRFVSSYTNAEGCICICSSVLRCVEMPPFLNLSFVVRHPLESMSGYEHEMRLNVIIGCTILSRKYVEEYNGLL